MDSVKLSLVVDYDAFCLGDCFANASDLMPVTAILNQELKEMLKIKYSSATVPRLN